ncbi:hypothetical protein [Geodermatophilus sp. CPCC 205506]|uniref:hypothetical protein n=1 Tax=Geodermatophilus sp. CPCC 205506 TaxID=2936596 RepID=UPI003EEB7FA0
MASTVLDPRTTSAPPSSARVHPPVTVLAAGAVAGLESVALVAGALTGLDGLLLSPLRPSGALVAVVLVALAAWVVLCAGGGALLVDGSGRRLFTGLATAELALVGVLLMASLVGPLPAVAPATLPALVLLLLAVPVGKLLLAGSPSALAWAAQGPPVPADRSETGPARPVLRAATLAVIGLALCTVALSTPAPGTASDAPATAGTSRP